MLVLTFIYAGLLVTLTVAAFAAEAAEDAVSFLFFSGAVAICALFALKSRRHGFVGATVLALLLVFTTSARIFGLMGSPGEVPLDLTRNVAALALSLSYLIAAHGTWQRYRRKVALEEMAREEGR